MRRPRDAVRHHDQPVAHRPEHGPDQRVEPVQRVHAPGQLGLQPREHQPAQVHRRGRQLRRRGLPAHRRGHVHRAGDPGRQRGLPDGEDRRDEPPVPPARPGLREPRRAADVAGSPVRLAVGSRLGRVAHRADDRPRVRHERPHRGSHGPVRRVRGQRRADAQRAAHAPGRSGQDRRGAGAAGAALRRAAVLGRRGRAR